MAGTGERRSSLAKRGAYPLALLAVAAAALLRYGLNPVLEDDAPFQTFYIAALLAAATGGRGPGILATVLGAVLGEWLFVEPRGHLWLGTPDALARLTVFLVVGTGVSLIAGRLHARRDEAERHAVDLEAMLDLVDLGHLLTRDINDRILRWTAGCERIYGYTPAEAIGRVSQDLLRTEFPLPLETIRTQLFETGRWEGELVHRHKDGRRVTIAGLWVLHRDAAGRPAAILESHNNISGLRLTEERLRLVLDAARIGTWDFDLQTGALEWSRQCLELFGLPPGTVMSYERFLQAVHPEDRARVEARAREALERRSAFDVELRTIWPDGTVHWIASHGRAYYDASGRPYRMAGAALDATERRTADQALRRSERRFRGTFENAAVGIGHIDLEGRFLLVNERFRQMLGYDDLKGRCFLDLTHVEDRGCDEARFRAMARGECDSDTLEKRYVRSDAADVWALVTRSLQRDEANRPAYVISVVQDITDRKRAEEALRESELFHRQTLESIPGMVFTTRPDGYCDYQSQQWVMYTGVPMNEHLGDGWNRLLHPEDRPRALAAWRAAVEGAARYDLEYRIRRRDGEYEWFKVVGQPIKDGTGRIARWFGIALNVEDLKRAESALRTARRAAEEASSAKDRFLAVLSHELRTPLTPAVAALSMLREVRDLDPQVRESLEVIRRNVEMEARLIDDLLDVTRIVSGKVALDRRPVTLGEVIGRAVDVCRPDMEARRLHFGLDLGGCDGSLVHGDPARLQQVFWNLLQNAIKFTPRGGCVGIRCHLDDHHVTTEVIDSGEGIEPSVLPHVFNPFEQGGGRVTRQFGGLGLGLTISKGFVEMHGGEITAHSGGTGQGATFSVRLPLAAGAAVRPAASPVANAPLPRPAGPARPLHVLLVEDHGDTAMMMQWFLTAQGHEVKTAGDVATALELVATGPFDVLVSDLGLPDGSGIELMATLRARGFTLPGVALSGFGQEEDIRRSGEAGFAAHLTKPASPERLIEAIAAVTARRPG